MKEPSNASRGNDPIRLARLLSACEQLAQRLEIEIIRERIESGAGGGLCRLRGQWRLYLDVEQPPEEHLEAFVLALARFDLSEYYVLPALRELLDADSTARNRAERSL